MIGYLFYPINRLVSYFRFLSVKVLFYPGVRGGMGSVILSNFSLRVGLRANIFLGKHLIFRRNVSVNVSSGNLSIADRCFFNNSCSINCQLEIVIGPNCLFGESVKLYDHDHCYYSNGVSFSDFRTSSIHIGSGSWIGSDAVILRGANIGCNCVVAAGSIVRSGVYPDNSLIFSNGKFKKIKYDK